MNYEQENHKIRRTWEQDQTNINNIAKQKNSSIILPGSPQIASPKKLIVPSWQSISPYFIGKSEASILFPVDGQLTCRTNYGYFEFDLSSDTNQYEININGTIKRITASRPMIYPTHVEGRVEKVIDLPILDYDHNGDIYLVDNDDSDKNGYYVWDWYSESWGGPSQADYGNPTWSWDAEIDNLIGYGGSYTIKARPFIGRWGKYGPSITFHTYPYYPVPPNPSNVALLNFQGNTSLGYYDGPTTWTGGQFIPPQKWVPDSWWFETFVPGHYVAYTYYFPSRCPCMFFTYNSDKCLSTLHQVDTELEILVTNYSLPEYDINGQLLRAAGPIFASMGGGFYINSMGEPTHISLNAAVSGIDVNNNSKFKIISNISGDFNPTIIIHTEYYGGGVVYSGGPNSDWETLPPSITDTYWIHIDLGNTSFLGSINSIKILTQNCTLSYRDGSFCYTT